MNAFFETVVNGLAGPSPIFIGRGLLAEVGAIVAPRTKGRRAVVVSDTNVAPLHAGTVVDSLRAAGFEVALEVIPAGEETKQLASLERLWNAFHTAGLTRRDVAVAVGGGVVGDLTGFAAATWLRGISVVQAPTSMLAFVDSSIGGKTGIDLSFGKNLAGAFHQPLAVIGDPLVLRTLPAREFSQGMAEVVKYGCFHDFAFFERLEALADAPLSDAALEEVIARCAGIKAEVVNADEREGGRRMLLNFGHTLGHAVEATLGFGVMPHGEAVAVGMVAAARLGEMRGLTPAGTADRIRALLVKLNLPVEIPAACTNEAIATAMLSDKKKLGAQIHWVLLEALGRGVVVPLDPEDVRAALPALRGKRMKDARR